MIPDSLPVNPSDWRDDAKKSITNDKEVIINGVCVMNQSSEFKSDDGNLDQSNEDGGESESRLTIAEGNEEDVIKKSFIRKPSMEKASIDSSDDVKVKKEIDEAGAWEY